MWGFSQTFSARVKETKSSLVLSEDDNEKDFSLPESFSRNQIKAVEGLLLDYDGQLVLEKDSDSNAIKVVKKYQ